MPASSYPPYGFPDVILLLGTDASGKDHVAGIIETMIAQAGGTAEKRRRFFSGAITREASSTGKNWLDTLQEVLFLSLHALLGPLLPRLLDLLIRRDLQRFRRPAGKLVVVGHNGLRGLAFHFGNSRRSTGPILLPPYLQRTFARLRAETGAHIIVLDVEDHIRKRRIADRLATGQADRFDRYMAADGRRSERIEACLVDLVCRHLGGVLIANNDLSDEELQERILSGFQSAGDRAG
jgi:hypothetical protein